ncbi:GDSL esterase/lipase At5g62930-like isoform X1 [Wolffia australiana]
MGSPETRGRRSRIVLFGDSITEQSFRPGGWGASLADAYSRKADIIIRGYGGYNSRWALYLLGNIFPPDDAQPPVAATIFFGANDAALLERHSERQHVPLEEYKDNLKLIVQHLKNLSPTMLIVLISPPPVDEDGRMKFARLKYGAKVMELPERTNKITGLYAKECVSLASTLRVPCIDLWSQMQKTDGWQEKFLRETHMVSGVENTPICFRRNPGASSPRDVQEIPQSPSGSSRKRRTPKAKIMEYFTRIGPDKYACELCRKLNPTSPKNAYKRNRDGSTNVFWRHLQYVHRKVHDELKGISSSQLSIAHI